MRDFTPGTKIEARGHMNGTCAPKWREASPRITILTGELANVRPSNLHIVNTLKLVDEMIYLADRGDADREDNGCGILFGVLRDSAFKLKKLAEEEKLNHIKKGWWQSEELANHD